MASKKTAKAPAATETKAPEVNSEVVVEAPVEQATEIKEQPEVPVEEMVEAPKAPAATETKAPEVKVKEKAVVKEITEKTVEEKELPDYAKRVLKIFSDQPELYITTKGGAFPPTAKPSERGSAILYKNPYYKS